MKLLMFLSIIILISYSCKNDSIEEPSFTSRLTSDSTKYWDVVEQPNLYSKNTSKVFPFYWYSFGIDGKYKFYSKKNNKRAYREGGDVVLLERWSLTQNEILIINGDTVKVVLLSVDTLKYLNNKKELIVLAKSKNQSSTMDSIVQEIPMISPIR